MPTLKDIPDLFHGYDPESGYLAIPEMGSGEVFSQLMAAGNKSAAFQFALQDYRSFASVARGAIGMQALRMGGVPSWLAGPVGQTFELIPLVTNGALLIKVGKDIVTSLGSAAEDVSGAIDDAASAVPVIGAIVRLGIGLYQAISAGIAAGNNEVRPRPPQKFAPMTYDYAADLGNGNSLHAIAGSDDWTDLFLPPSADPDFHVGLLESSMGGTKWWVPPTLGVGLVPGVADQVGEYQSFNTGAALSTGNYRPSSRKFATMLWNMVMKPSVQMFNIDSAAIASAWPGYYDALWKLADRDFAGLGLNEYLSMWLRARIRQTASYSKLYNCEAATKWKANTIGNCQWDPKTGKVDSTKLSPPVFKPKSVLDAFPREALLKRMGKLTGLYTDVVNYVCQIHRARAADALRTLVVAYVPSNAPALRGDEGLRKLHAESRGILLHDRARYDVEMELVPHDTDDDQAFRDALNAARVPGFDMTADVDIASNVHVKKRRGKVGTPPRVGSSDGDRPPDAPPVGIPEGVGGGSGVDGGVGWVLALAGGAAVVAGGVALARRTRKR